MKPILFVPNCSATRARLGSAAFALFTFIALAGAIHADVLEMTNGDHYTGTVVSMNENAVEFKSEIQGVVKIPRAKIASINLGSAGAANTAAAVASGNTNSPVARTNTAPVSATSATNSSIAIVAELRKKGADPKTISQIQEQIIGKSSPEAAQKFNQMVAGLMTGSLKIEDIRAQARKAIQDIQTAKEELGPDAGEMLDGYLKILTDFLNEAEPAAPATAEAAGKTLKKP